MRSIGYKIASGRQERTIAIFLKQKGYSTRLLRHLKEGGGIFVNEKPEPTGYVLQAADLLTVRLPVEIPSEKIEPVPLEFGICYEDEDILVADKPAGMPTHPSHGNYGNTLANAVAYHARTRNEAFIFRAVNRLDKDTTGLVLIAKNALSASVLSQRTAKGRIEKQYLAICQGETPNKGRIDAPIARKEGSILERTVDFERGERAVTTFRTETRRDGCSLVRLCLETGRTHQIRVHMKYLGFPLLGDFLYYPDFTRISRQALHCCRLRLEHPVTGESMVFEASLPEDMNRILID